MGIVNFTTVRPIISHLLHFYSVLLKTNDEFPYRLFTPRTTDGDYFFAVEELLLKTLKKQTLTVSFWFFIRTPGTFLCVSEPTFPHCLHFPSCRRLWTQWCLSTFCWQITALRAAIPHFYSHTYMLTSRNTHVSEASGPPLPEGRLASEVNLNRDTNRGRESESIHLRLDRI